MLLPLLLAFLSFAAFILRFGAYSDAFYGDALGYYSYLPSGFIHGDAGQAHLDMEQKGYPPPVASYFEVLSTLQATPSGQHIVQYTLGVAILEAPFFALARLCSAWTGMEASGYGPMHQGFRQAAGIVYVLLGFGLLWSLMGRLGISPKAKAWSLFFGLMGSNLLWFLACQPGMAHPLSFFLVALLLWATEAAYRKENTRSFVLVGMSLGLLTLIRPTDAVFLLIPLVYGRRSSSAERSGSAGLNKQLQERLQWFWRMRSKIGWTILAGLVMLLPQLLYWKAHTGSWVYYSYNEQGFFWNQPKIYKGLFSYQNGWFSYTPIMLMPILGMLWRPLRRKAQPWMLPSLLLLPVLIYVTYSWWCWYYMNGFGSRPMIHAYPLLLVLLAAGLDALMGKARGHDSRPGQGKSLLKQGLPVVAFIALAFCTLWSLSLHRHSALNQLKSELGHQAFVERLVFLKAPRYDDLVLWDTRIHQPDSNAFGERRLLAKSPPNAGPNHLEASDQWYTGLEWTVPEAYAENNPGTPQRWWRCEGNFRPLYHQGNLYRQHGFVVQVMRQGEQRFWTQIRINNKGGASLHTEHKGDALRPNRKALTNLVDIHHGSWAALDVWIPVPKDLQAGDAVRLLVWNRAGQPIDVGSFLLEEASMR